MCRFGMRDLPYKKFLKTIWKNDKIEVVLYAILLISMSIIGRYTAVYDFIERNLICYITNERIALITSVMAVFIGIYTTVLTIIATSKISISELILKLNMDSQILTIISFGMAEDFILIIFGVFFNIDCWILLLLYFVILCNTLISFFKFTRLVYCIFKININQMVKELDRESADRAELKANIEEILYRMKKFK